MILIVDDRRENILPLKKILELHRFSVDTAESGEEALKKVLNTAYSVIILDVQMPDMDGFEVARAVAGFGKSRDTSIIFLSAVNTEKKFITQGYTAGAIDYLIKPVDPDILVLKVRTLERLYKQQQELRTAQDSLRKEVAVRKQAEAELAAHVQELQTILSSLPQMAFTVTADGQIETVNEHWFRYATSATTFPETDTDSDVCAMWKQALAAGVDFTSELRLRDLKTGELRYHLLRIIPIKQQGILIRWIGTFTDIHTQKQATDLLEQEVEARTAELRLKNTELEQTNNELQQFTWVVSHDLKEPLRKIQLLNDTIKAKFLQDNDEAVTYLDRSIRSSARMSELINDLLTYSRLSNAVLFEPTDLNTLLNEIALDFDDVLIKAGATLTIGEFPVVDAMPGRMRQIFHNLISNALKFSKPDRPPVISIQAERIDSKAFDGTPSPNGTFCRITVEDNGIGFDEKFLDRIFVIFQRLHSRSQYEGTGIGLAIVKKNIQTHNGIITAQSRIDEGTRFVMVLPLQQNSSAPIFISQ